MKQLMAVISMPALFVIGALVLYRQWRYDLYATHSAEDVATQDVMMLVVAVLVAACCIALVYLGMHLGRDRHPQADTTPDDAPIDTTYRITPRSPRADMETPITVNVPRFTQNGTSQPLGITPSRAVLVQTTTDTDEQLSIPLQYLRRFATCTTPSRAEWSGKSALYGDCLAFYKSHGLIEQTTPNKYAWRYGLRARAEWLSQFSPTPEAGTATF